MNRASWRFVFVAGLVVLAGLALSAIVGAQAAAPDITAVQPNPVQPAMDAQPISVSGHGFLERLVLSVTGPDGNALEYREPAIRDRQERSFVVPVVFATAGAYTLVVTNSDGGTSNAFAVQAKAQAVAPVIEGIKPERLQASMNPQALQVQGQRFAPGTHRAGDRSHRDGADDWRRAGLRRPADVDAGDGDARAAGRLHDGRHEPRGRHVERVRVSRQPLGRAAVMFGDARAAISSRAPDGGAGDALARGSVQGAGRRQSQRLHARRRPRIFRQGHPQGPGHPEDRLDPRLDPAVFRSRRLRGRSQAHPGVLHRSRLSARSRDGRQGRRRRAARVGQAEA